MQQFTQTHDGNFGTCTFRLRRTLILLTMILGTLSWNAAKAQYYQMAHWDFTNASSIVTDLSGRGNNGVVIGGGLAVPNCMGQPNQALRLGPGKWVQVPSSPDFCHGEWTINVVAKLNNLPSNPATCNWATLLSHDVRYGNNYYSIEVSDFASSGSCGSGGTPRWVGWAGGSYPSTAPPAATPPQIVAGCWYCFTAVYNPNSGGSVTLYVDGVPVTSYAWPYVFGAPCSPMDLLIGKGDWGGNPTWWDGDIDDIQIWRNAMTASDVAAYFPCPACPGSANCGTNCPNPPCGTQNQPCNTTFTDIQIGSSYSTPFDRSFTATTSGSGATAIRWTVNAGPISVTPLSGTFNYSFPGPGTYSVCAVIIGAAGQICDTRCFEICICGNGYRSSGRGAKLAPEKTSQEVGKVYPNPTSGELNIPVTGYTGPVNITISDASGRMLISQTHEVDAAGGPVRISGNRLPPGSYFLELKAGSQSSHQQFIKQ